LTFILSPSKRERLFGSISVILFDLAAHLSRDSRSLICTSISRNITAEMAPFEIYPGNCFVSAVARFRDCRAKRCDRHNATAGGYDLAVDVPRSSVKNLDVGKLRRHS